jgi:Protein of unknown function (DUF2752)
VTDHGANDQGVPGQGVPGHGVTGPGVAGHAVADFPVADLPVATARAPGVRDGAVVRRLAAPVGALAGVAAAFGYVGMVNPNVAGHYPVCPLLKSTGIYCPGCGGLRSAYAVVHGDFATAVGDNALAVAGYVVFAVLWVVWTVRAVRGQPVVPRVRPAYWWGIGALVLAFTVIRNLPFGAALAP